MVPVVLPDEATALAHAKRTRTFLAKYRDASKARRDEGLWKQFRKAKTGGGALVRALARPFHGKCAYCESIEAQDVDHFRPKAGPRSFPELAFVWENFRLCCKNCNHDKGDRFPVDDRGAPLLIDPCQDDPSDHFAWDPLTGKMVVNPSPASMPRAEATRDAFKLDGEAKCASRTNKQKLVRFLLSCVARGIGSEAVRCLRDELGPERPWMGIVRQMVKEAEGPDAELFRAAKAKCPELEEWARAWS